uniref:Clc-like protein n=1 Tax=Strongyloides papillosus TaxID=174720 RepID=A0A0N5BXI7_STREA
MASTVSQKVLLVLSIIFIVLGLALTLGGAFSPAWQIVDIREFRAEHQHGLWWDCVRAEKHVVAVGDFYDETPLHCMQKFDRSAELVIEDTLNNIDEDGAAGESEHHRFWAWHKIVLFFILFGAFSAFISICTGVCAPCFPPCAFVFSISLFVAMICSMIADGVFFLAANRVDNRFVQGMVGTYEQNIGYAFYIHLFGTLAWILAFICTLATTYKFFSTNRRKEFISGFKSFSPQQQNNIGHNLACSYQAQPRSGNTNNPQLNTSFSYNPGPKIPQHSPASFGSRV